MKNLSTILFFALAMTGCGENNELIETKPQTDSDINNIVTKANQYGNMSNASRSSSPASTVSYDGRNVKITVLSRNVGDSKNDPIFKYSDIINRAIAYKQLHPSTDVQIKFVMYKISSEAYVGFDPSDINSYGYVKGNDFGGVHSEKLIYSIVKAALNQVKIDFAYHFDEGSTNTYNYINGFMDNPCTTDNTKKVSDYLRIRKITWGTESHQQMHAKYLTVNYYTGDNNTDENNTVLSTTGNVDSHGSTGIPTGKDWVQSGILINGHQELTASYNSYFDLIFDNYSNQEAFKNAVRVKHASQSLNYDDTYFSSYFTPIPLNPSGNYTYIPETGDGSTLNGDAWDTSFNPVAKYVEQMATVPGNRYLKVNMYHLKTDNFGKKFYNKLEEIYNSESSGLKHFRFVVNTNSYNTIFPLSNFNNIGIIKSSAATHSKDLLFAFSGLSRYYTITGSTNLKLDDNASKANSSLVVKEYTTAHPIYNEFKTIFEYQ